MGKVGRWAVRFGAAAHGAVKWTVYCLAIALVGGTVVYALIAAWLGLPTKQLLARVPVAVPPEAIGVGALVVLVLVVTDTEDSGIVRNELGSRNVIEATGAGTSTLESDGGQVATTGEASETTAIGTDPERSPTDASAERGTAPEDGQGGDAAGDGEGATSDDAPAERTNDEGAGETASEPNAAASDTDERVAAGDESESTDPESPTDDPGPVETETAPDGTTDAGADKPTPEDGSAPETTDGQSSDAAATGREPSGIGVQTHPEQAATPGRDTGTRRHRLSARAATAAFALVVGLTTCYLLFRVLRRQ